MEGVFCSDAIFLGANLRGADLYWAVAFRASFVKADLSFAKLNGANLMETDFTDANLEGADLSRDNLGGSTRLHGANFSNTNLKGARFGGAEYDSATIFPTGFDPRKHGMVYRDREDGKK